MIPRIKGKKKTLHVSTNKTCAADGNRHLNAIEGKRKKSQRLD